MYSVYAIYTVYTMYSVYVIYTLQDKVYRILLYSYTVYDTHMYAT